MKCCPTEIVHEILHDGQAINAITDIGNRTENGTGWMESGCWGGSWGFLLLFLRSRSCLLEMLSYKAPMLGNMACLSHSDHYAVMGRDNGLIGIL